MSATMVLAWIAVAAGFVVTLVAAALLHALLLAVHRVERSVTRLWSTATTVARNTATTWQLDVTAERLEQVKAEALRHDALFSGAAVSPDGRHEVKGRSR